MSAALVIAVTALVSAASPHRSVVLHDAPDPTCATGVPEGQAFCCLKSCGKCGGATCSSAPGGPAGCCGGAIQHEGRSCDKVGPPCMMAPPPPPATSCGDFPEPLNKSAKANVILVGDSISMPLGVSPGGYGNNVRAILDPQGIHVWHNGGWGVGGQASNTVKGLKCTNSSTLGNWLNFTGTADVIHFNFGLHDLEDPGGGGENVPLAQYGINLQEIYKKFATKATKVIWTTTTPCPNVTTSYGRTNALVEAYNAEALKSLTAIAPTLIVDDLYKAVDTYCGVDYKTCDLQLPANVHFTPKGCEFMGQEVSKSILAALGH